MIKYRKNSNWKTLSFETSNSSDIDDKIKNETLRISIPNRYYMDIIDISIRSTVIGETSYSYSKEKHFITIIYAFIEEKEGKITI